MKLLSSRTSAVFSLVFLAFSFGACAAVEKSAVEIAEQRAVAALKWTSRELAPLWRKEGAAAQNALERQFVSWTLKSEQRVVFRAFEAVRPGVRWQTVVRRDVHSFVRSFEAGARDPEPHFTDPLVDRALVARWKATPKEDRIFVAGTQHDTPVIESLGAELEREGKTVFFYMLCSGVTGVLCDSRTVGAFFGTAGTAVLAVTDSTASSRFVSHEVAAAARLATGRSELVIFTPSEAINKTAGVRMVQATIDSDQSSPY